MGCSFPSGTWLHFLWSRQPLKRLYPLGCGQRSRSTINGVRDLVQESDLRQWRERVRQSVWVCCLCVWCWAWSQRFLQLKRKMGEKWQEAEDKPELHLAFRISNPDDADELQDELEPFHKELHMLLAQDLRKLEEEMGDVGELWASCCRMPTQWQWARAVTAPALCRPLERFFKKILCHFHLPNFSCGQP